MLKSFDRDISIISPHSADPRNNDGIQMFWNASKSKQLDGKEGKSEWTEIKLDKIRRGLEVRGAGKGYRFIGGEITNENREGQKMKVKRKEEGCNDEGMDDEGVGDGLVQEGGFGWQGLNRPLFFPTLASLIMQNRPVQPPSHPSHKERPWQPFYKPHTHIIHPPHPTISQPCDPTPNRERVGTHSVHVAFGGWAQGIFTTNSAFGKGTT